MPPRKIASAAPSPKSPPAGPVRHFAAGLAATLATCLVLQACQSQGVPVDGGQDGNLGIVTQPSEPNNLLEGGGVNNNNNTSGEPVPPVTGGNAAVPPNAISPNLVTPANANPNLRFVGRFDTSNPNAPIMAWPGSKIIAGFSGTSLTLNMRAVDQRTYFGIGNVDNYLAVSIDGNAAAVLRIPQGVTSFSLAKGLAAGNHTVEVTKRTEGQIGSLQFLGFGLDAGATLVPGPAPQTRRLEVIGDSGSVGYGVEGNWALTRCSFTPATENAAASYSLVAASLLNAEVHVTGGSGKGIYQNRDTRNDAYYTLPVMWQLTSPDTFAQPENVDLVNWNPNAWTPDAVVVIVGGNDFAASTPPAAAYNARAVDFLKALRKAHPNAWLYVAISPMLDPPVAGSSGLANSQVAINYAQAAVQSMADAKVNYLSLPLDNGSRGLGCDTHLNVASGKVYGQAIAAAIAKDLNWN